MLILRKMHSASLVGDVYSSAAFDYVEFVAKADDAGGVARVNLIYDDMLAGTTASNYAG